MSNPNKTFKAQHTGSLVDKIIEDGKIDLQLELEGGSTHSMSLKIIVFKNGRIRLLDFDTGKVMLEYDDKEDFEDFIRSIY